MKKIWTLAVLVVMAGVVMAWTSSCRKDVFVPPPPSIVGKYMGTYCYREDDHNPLTSDLDTCQFVKVTFKVDSWIMSMDESKTNATARMACDCNGDYTLENGVQLVLVDSNATNKVCTYGWLPDGSFLLIQNAADTLCTIELQQVYPDNVRNLSIYKTFCLHPASF